MTIPANQFGYVLPEDRSYGVEKEHELIMQDVSSIMVSGAPIMGSGAGKIVLLHEVVTAVVGYYIYMAQSIGDCYVAGTMVSGPTVKPIEKIAVGDKVWTANGNQTTVISTRAISTAKPLVKVKPLGGLPITCTADHKMLVYRMARISGKRVTAAFYERALAAEDSTCGFTRSRVIDCYESRAPEWVPAGELCDTDYLLTPLKVSHSAPPELPFGMFELGFFLGNGYAAKDGSSAASAEWVGNHKYDHFANFIEDALTGAGFCPKRDSHKERNAWRIRVHSESLCSWLRQTFYDENDCKVFPDWAIGNEAFLNGLRAADGHGDGTIENIDSTSHSIAYGVQASLLELGYDATICEVSRSKGTYANAKPLYRVTWRPQGKQRGTIWRDEHFMCRPVRSVELIEGPSTVYDIGVADNHHSFLANGYATHNCVSFGWAKGIMISLACDIAMRKESEQWPGAEIATEWLYGTSRVLVGKGRLGNSDGSVGSWMSKAVSPEGHGTLLRKKYGAHDLTKYSGKRAKSWGYDGLPFDLEQTADEHPVSTKPALVNSYEQARDSIANGYPVPVCSNQGFSDVRDSQGFAKPSGRWGHCMCFIAVDDTGNRPGLLCDNSWPKGWISGPKRHNQPDGSFWVDADTADRMLKQNDSFAVPGFEGYAAANLDWSMF